MSIPTGRIHDVRTPALNVCSRHPICSGAGTATHLAHCNSFWSESEDIETETWAVNTKEFKVTF